ncbi:MAG TPA: maltotransferase domain-containing protein, partial [Thermoanaerobaculia bacterium]|nr:maltotransferase domain-containing protein [Thermoanaerobaculia bacterium]
MVTSAEVDGRRRVVIEGVQPEVDAGLFPAKRVAGDSVVVEADIFADGHDVLSAVVLYRHATEKKFREVRMLPMPNDRWRAELTVEQLGYTIYTIEAWVDHFLTWHRDLKKRVAAQQSDIDVQLQIGLEMVRAASRRAKARDRKKLDAVVKLLEGEDTVADKVDEMYSADLLELMWRNAERRFVTRYPIEVFIEVDRKKAEFSTWYEMFPR